MTTMYRRIEQFLSNLEAKQSLASRDALASLAAFAGSLGDEDYTAELYGGAGVRLCRSGHYELAEKITSLAQGPERARQFRQLAEELRSANQVQRSLEVYSLVRETVLSANYSTGTVQELEQSAKNLAKLGRRDLAIKFWEDAVALAGPQQSAGGQEGLESSGTLWEAVKGLCELGEIERAREIAAAIQLDFLKARALGLIEKHGNASQR